MSLPSSPLSASPTWNTRPPHPHPHPRPARPPRQPISPVVSLTRSIQPNPSSTSVAPSVAEGRPIPLDDDTAAHRTTALRELNSHYPSRHRHRHRYAKSTGAQSTTHSEPVIVRSYYAARSPPSRPAAVSVTGSSTGRPASSSHPFRSKLASSLAVGTMVLSRGKKPVDGRAQEEQPEARLPPVDAFTFKSFMANIEAQGGGGSASASGSTSLAASAADISADLDRIAEICARSRYSLSNQYDVHFTPHGSGSLFSPSTSSVSPNDESRGPTLQAVTSDDDDRDRLAGSTRRRRRMLQAHHRRNSRAIGTLETIISSSRSSDEEQSAAEAADQHVRGRASMRAPSSHSSHGTPPERQSPRAASAGRKTPKHPAFSVARGAITPVAHAVDASTGILSMMNGWRPWRPYDHGEGLAAGSLRDLLKSDGKKRR